MTKIVATIFLFASLIAPAFAAAQKGEPGKVGYYKNGVYYAPRGETMEQCTQRHLDRGAHSMKAIRRACERTTKKK